MGDTVVVVQAILKNSANYDGSKINIVRSNDGYIRVVSAENRL